MKKIIAMHGWGGDSNRWQLWLDVFKKDGWQWDSAERGYGEIPAYMPTWENNHKKNSSHQNVVICHSLGSHLLDHIVLKNATHIVLLSSFSRFIPLGKESRLIKAALQGMKRAIGTPEEQKMFLNFIEKATKPHTINSISKTPLTNGLSTSGRQKLQSDLQLLINSNSLSTGFPSSAQVLIVNGKNDEILSKETKEILRKDLRNHLQTPPTEWNLDNEGHALLDMKIITKVKEWLK